MKTLLNLGLLVGLVTFGLTGVAYADDAAQKTFEEVKTDLQAQGVEVKDIDQVKKPIEEMVAAGVPAKEAGSVVSQAAKKAKAEGLKGKELAARVKDAAKARKGEHKAAKDEAKKVAKNAEKKADKMKNQAKEKSKDVEESLKGKGRGKN
jgi:methylthioribose-1-phosphate isomerase